MEIESNSKPLRTEESSYPKKGCGSTVLFVFVLLFILGSIAAAQLMSWSVEQAVFEGSLPIPDLRWLVALLFGIILFLPMIFLSLVYKNNPLRRVYRLFAISAIPAIILVPSRLVFITNSQLIAVLQIVGLGIFSGALLWRQKQGNSRNLFQRSPGSIRTAFIVAGLAIIPWVVWGALGSILDSLLGMGVGLLFGLSASLAIKDFFEEIPNPAGMDSARSENFLEIVSIFAALLILSTGTGQNGQQWMLLLTIPGFALTAILMKRRLGSWDPIAGTIMIGLCAAWPLIWIDSDELSFVINGGQGELISWAIKASLAAGLIGMVSAAIIPLLQSNSKSPAARTRTLSNVFVIIIWLAAAGLYAEFGKVGFFGERLFVILKQQSVFTKAELALPYIQRRPMVFHKLVSSAEENQKRLIATLEQFGINYKRYYLVNALEVRDGPLLRAWLNAQPEVDRVLDSPALRPLPGSLTAARGTVSTVDGINWNLAMIHADRVWSELHVDGKGVIIGQSDSGVQYDHPELKGAYRGSGGSNDFNWYDPWNHTPHPIDLGGHGTHTLGIVLGNHVGVAPGATWIGCSNLSRNLGNPALYLECMQFMLAPFPQAGDALKDGDPSLGAMVMNNSWGCPPVEGCDADALGPAVKSLRDAGIFVVVSAGNSGQKGCGSVSDPPALYSEAFTVGAVDRGGELASFSSLGPVTVDKSRRPKPDLLAPGVDVLSSYPGGTYETASGTSMAGPHVVGVVALMWSANPKLIGDIDKTARILNASADPYTGQPPACADSYGGGIGVMGHGVVDAFKAVTLALENR